MAKPKRIWTDGLKGEKTATNPKGGGRVKGRKYEHLIHFPGAQAEQRLSWSRMKAQAKFRKEIWDLSWEDYKAIWEGKWHLRGTTKESMVLTKINMHLPWTTDNVEICPRLEQWRRQNKTNLGKTYKPRLVKNKQKTT